MTFKDRSGMYGRLICPSMVVHGFLRQVSISLHLFHSPAPVSCPIVCQRHFCDTSAETALAGGEERGSGKEGFVIESNATAYEALRSQED